MLLNFKYDASFVKQVGKLSYFCCRLSTGRDLLHCLYRAPDRPFLEAERTTQDGGPFNTDKVGVSLYPI